MVGPSVDTGDVSVLFGIVVVVACAIALGFAAVLVVRPATVLSSMWRVRPSPSNVEVSLYQHLLNLPPYKWLFSGHSWEVLNREAREHPEMFPRVLMVYRALGVLVFVVAAVIVVVLTAMVVVNSG
jgi:hypothetical protein